MKKDHVIVLLALVAFAAAMFIDGTFKFVLLGFAIGSALIFTLRLVTRNKSA